MNDQAAVPVTEQTPIAEQPIADAGPPVKTKSTKSAVQKRFDQLTREKYAALHQVEDLSGENAELRKELQQAKSLLESYRTELEKYRTRFVEIAATKEKPKHGR